MLVQIHVSDLKKQQHRIELGRVVALEDFSVVKLEVELVFFLFSSFFFFNMKST